jgi:hypothetical protein
MASVLFLSSQNLNLLVLSAVESDSSDEDEDEDNSFDQSEARKGIFGKELSKLSENRQREKEKS